MSNVFVFISGIILSILGLILFLPNSNASGPEAYEELYWVFGGCLLSLAGILVIIMALLWPSKSINVVSSEIGDVISTPPPVISDKD